MQTLNSPLERRGCAKPLARVIVQDALQHSGIEDQVQISTDIASTSLSTPDLVQKHLSTPHVEEDLQIPSTEEILNLSLVDPVLDPRQSFNVEAHLPCPSAPASSITTFFEGHEDVSDLPDPAFQDMRNWLALLCEEEQSKVDWTPSPEHTLPAADRVPPEPGIDTEILELIEMGLGPRPDEHEIEDLVAKLRQTLQLPETLEQKEERGGAPKTRSETYEELKAVLQEWNLAVSSLEVILEARRELVLVLDERRRLFERMLHGSRVPEELSQQSTRLMQVLYAYRPEIMHFKDQKPYDVMVAMIANHRIAKPDIDDDVWDAMFKALLMELKLQLPKYMLERELFIEEQLKSKAARKDKERWDDLCQEYYEKYEERGKLIAVKLLDDLKAARRNLRLVVLGQMQDLTMLQAGQKWVANELGLEVTPEILEEKCEAADADLETVVRKQYNILEAELAAVEIGNTLMLQLSGDCYARAQKIEGEHVDDLAERKRVVEKRKNDPATAIMKVNMARDELMIGEVSRDILFKRLETIGTALQQVHEAAAHQYREYAEWFQMVDETFGDAGVLEPLDVVEGEGKEEERLGDRALLAGTYKDMLEGGEVRKPLNGDEANGPKELSATG